jgi:hypothetical protein
MSYPFEVAKKVDRRPGSDRQQNPVTTTVKMQNAQRATGAKARSDSSAVVSIRDRYLYWIREIGKPHRSGQLFFKDTPGKTGANATIRHVTPLYSRERREQACVSTGAQSPVRH